MASGLKGEAVKDNLDVDYVISYRFSDTGSLLFTHSISS